MKKQAILVVSFGTSHHETCDKNIGAIEQAIAARYPDWDIHRAFTSGMIRRKLKKRDAVQVDSVEEALSRLADKGYGTVLCQPTHVINGEEFDDIRDAVAGFAAAFDCLRVGAPLLTAAADYQELAGILDSRFPQQQDTAYCLMGHGSQHHHADASYAALDCHLGLLGREDVHVGTVEGFPDFDTMLRQVEKRAPKRCVLAPLMVVAGDHAVNDMASDDEDSWKTRLEEQGFAVECILCGLGEDPLVREIYVRHVGALMEQAGV